MEDNQQTLCEFLIEKFGGSLVVEQALSWKGSQGRQEGEEEFVLEYSKPVAHADILAAIVEFYEARMFTMKRVTSLAGWGVRSDDMAIRTFVLTTVPTVRVTIGT